MPEVVPVKSLKIGSPSTGDKHVNTQPDDGSHVHTPAQATTLPRVRSMTGPKTARTLRGGGRAMSNTPVGSVQRSTQGGSLPSTQFMASVSRNEETEVDESEAPINFPQGPLEIDPVSGDELQRAMASASLRTLRQSMKWALQKDTPGHNVDPEGQVQAQLAGAPYNKSDNAHAVDTDELIAHMKSTSNYSFR
jgi:hypothetical protein